MYDDKKEVLPFKSNLTYLNTCPNSPEYGMAFCSVHCHSAKSEGIPCKLKEYLMFEKAKKAVKFKGTPSII